MRRIAGSARYFRSALWHRKFDYWSSFTTRPKDLTENYHNCAYGVTNNAEIESFLRSKFMVSRALSTDAAANASIGGFFTPLFLILSSGLVLFLLFFNAFILLFL